MSYRCQVSGCLNRPAGYSPLCHSHRSRKRRHGHEEQRTISKTSLKPFIDKVQARIAKQPDAKLWFICNQRWDALIEHLKEPLPPVFHRARRVGTQEMLRLAETVSGRDVVVIVIAMYLLQDYDPRLFRSEHAFRTQLVRRVRSLSSSSFQRWGGAPDGRNKRAMKELEPSTVEFISVRLVKMFGPAGLKVVQLERREEKERKNATLDFYSALSEVT